MPDFYQQRYKCNGKRSNHQLVVEVFCQQLQYAAVLRNNMQNPSLTGVGVFTSDFTYNGYK